MDLWEDDLLDDDFSDEEEELEDLPEDEALDLPRTALPIGRTLPMVRRRMSA